jgi:hypothetical protein
MFPLHNNYTFRGDYCQTLTLNYWNAPGNVLQSVYLSNFVSVFAVPKIQRLFYKQKLRPSILRR